MAIDLYHAASSPACLTVRLVATALDIKLNLIAVDLQAGDHQKPDYLKLNPQHTVPTIVDNGFSLWESRAIARYLASKYGADSGLYPQDLQARARVDQLLDFDFGSLYQSFYTYLLPLVMGCADEALLKKLQEKLSMLNTFLEGQKYAVGSQLTLADLSLLATVSSIDIVGLSLAPYPNVVRWVELVKTTAPGFQVVIQESIDALKDAVAQIKAKQSN